MSIILEGMTKAKQAQYNEAAGAKYWTYNRSGKKTIVAVHGLRGTHHGLQFIAASLPEYKFIIPDLPGFGLSPALETTHSTEQYVDWLESFMKDLNLREKPILLGHSFGSIIASHFASKNPSKIEKLILINPIAKHGRTVGSSLARGYYGLGSILPGRVGDKLLRSRLVTRLTTISMLTTRKRELKRRVYEQHFAYFATFAHKHSVNQSFKATMKDSVIDVAERLSMPVLLIVGAKDRFMPLEGQEELYKQLPDARLAIVGGTGHLVHYETPEKAAQAIHQFVD